MPRAAVSPWRILKVFLFLYAVLSILFIPVYRVRFNFSGGEVSGLVFGQALAVGLAGLATYGSFAGRARRGVIKNIYMEGAPSRRGGETRVLRLAYRERLPGATCAVLLPEDAEPPSGEDYELWRAACRELDEVFSGYSAAVTGHGEGGRVTVVIAVVRDDCDPSDPSVEGMLWLACKAVKEGRGGGGDA